MEKIKFCLVGAGSIGRRHLRLLLERPDVEICVAEPYEVSRERIKNEYPDVKCYNSMEDALAVEKIDAVIIATPHGMHAGMAIKALGYGLHVFCEKPMSDSLNECVASTEDALTINRQHMITIKDSLPIWKRNTNYPLTNRAANQLPLKFNRDGSFKIFVGEIPDGAELTLRFAVEDHEKACENLPRVFVNSEVCNYIGEIEDTRWSPEGKLLCYSIPALEYLDVICPYIIVNGETIIKYVDVIVKVK